MAEKTTFKSFVKSQDLFGKTVALAYKKKGAFHSMAGGVCSIILRMVYTYFWVVSFMKYFLNGGNFTTVSIETLTQQEDATYPEYKIRANQLSVAYNITSYDSSISYADMDKYVTGIWLQRFPDGTYQTFMPKSCIAILEDQGLIITDSESSQLTNFACPELDGVDILLKNNDQGDWHNDAYAFSFVVDTCTHLRKYTGVAEDYCVDMTAEGAPSLSAFTVDAKLQSQVFEVINFLENDSHA